MVPFIARYGRKLPTTEHGVLDATTDEAQIRSWCWNGALVAIATGRRSGVVALDIDIREGGSGLDSLQTLGINNHPRTATAHTPSGGIHCLFAWPGYEVPNSAGKLGPHLDVRGDGGALILPPGPGRYWDPHLGLDTPLAPMPDWIHAPVPRLEAANASRLEAASERSFFRPTGELSSYCEAALRRAYREITQAPDGQQESTLYREAYGLGQLVGEWRMPPALALDVLRSAADNMPFYDPGRPWLPKELERKINDRFTAGLRQPRPKEARHG